MKAPADIRSTRPGFTLIELLVVMAIMAALAALVAATAGYVQNKSKRSLAAAQIKAMEHALEKYKADYREYPAPVGNDRSQFADASYNVAGARMLYQALTGDGTDAIEGAGGESSTGEPGSSGDAYMAMSTDDNTQNMVFQEGGDYMLTDPFGKPYQYERYDPDNPRETNSTKYDLWSFAQENTNDHPERWVTNWGVN